MDFFLEEYDDFLADLNEIWGNFIHKYNFEVSKSGEGIFRLENDSTMLYIIIGGDSKIGYVFENPQTGVRYEEINLFLFFGKKSKSPTFFDEEYPISKTEWLEMYQEENFRGICRIDLPIVLNEIESEWLNLVNGNYSFEADFNAWRKWKISEKNKKTPADKLSFEAYLKDTDS